MSAPPSAFIDTGDYGTDHADDGYETDDREEPPYYDVRDDDPVERQPRGLKMTVKLFLCHIQCLLILCELILLPQFRLLFFVQTGEICLPPWAEVNMPTPEASHQ